MAFCYIPLKQLAICPFFFFAQPGHRAHSPPALKRHNRLEICTLYLINKEISTLCREQTKRWLVGWRAQYVMAVKSLRYPLNEETQLAKKRGHKNGWLP